MTDPSTRCLRAALLIALTCCAGSTFAGVSAYACTQPDGSIELSTKNTGPHCELLSSSDAAAEPAAAPAPVRAAAPAPAAASAPAAGADAAPAAERVAPDGSKEKAAEDPRKLYRDAMLKAAPNVDGTPAAPANPALSRRYLSTDRASYQKALSEKAQNGNIRQ
jgi:hypothetical protein